jgi:MFS family permease
LHFERSEQLLLLVLGGVVFLDTLDLSLVQVALPSIGSALHLPESQLQWIVSAFVLGYGGFLLFGGRSADVLGRKRVLVWGLIALSAASVLGAAATDGTLLIAARARTPAQRPHRRCTRSRRAFTSPRRRHPRC